LAEKETYLQYNLKNGALIRWPDNCFPLTFYIAPFRWYRGQGEANTYYSLVQRALRTWEQVSNRRCRFQLVQNLNDSQINLEWKRVDRKSLGYCLFNFDQQSRLYSAEVQIGLSDGILHAKYMDENEVYHTILHEIGHALGLGHSPYQSDIMYTPHQYGNVGLSQRDVNTIQWLYNLPIGSTVKDLNSKYRMNEQDIDVAIWHIMHGDASSEFERVKSSLPSVSQRNLVDEQSKLGEIKKYQVMALQNIQISQNTHNMLKRQRIQKNIENIKKQTENLNDNND
jgi:hypothetical protein